MNFPPPPPAPPSISQGYPAFTHSVAEQNGFRGRGNRGERGYRGQFRENRREGLRGALGGYLNPSAGYSDDNSASNARYPPQNSGYNAHSNNYKAGKYSTQQPLYPANTDSGYTLPTTSCSTVAPNYYSHQPYSPNRENITQYSQRQPHHGVQLHGQPVSNAPLNSYNSRRVESFPPEPTVPTSQPVMMGPPLRIGFDAQKGGLQSHIYSHQHNSDLSSYQKDHVNGDGSSYRRHALHKFQSAGHVSSNSYQAHRGRGQKRGHADAFGRARHQTSRTPVPPAVPNFGGPLQLPLKPPVPQESVRRPRKKKRKHNQLGLTPKTEDHESSEEEEDDADEESKLAAAVGGSELELQQLKFSYKGQTSTLQSSSDIAAWIEERKKKFPTKARAAEAASAKRQREGAQLAAKQARKEAQEKQKVEAKDRKKRTMDAESKLRRAGEGFEGVAAKAKRKVEKLRRQLEREERRIAKAEAKASKTETQTELAKDSQGAAAIQDQNDETKKRKRSASPGNVRAAEEARMASKAASNMADPLTPTSQPSAADEGPMVTSEAIDRVSAPMVTAESQNTPSKALLRDSPITDVKNLGHNSHESLSESSSHLSSTDEEDLTSSSGVSTSDAESNDEPPEQATSKRNGAEKVAAPKRVKTKQICRTFLRSGRCKWGEACKYRHELPERGSHAVRDTQASKPQARKERVGLFLRLVEQEKETEDKAILTAIIHLGERGLLDQPAQGNGETATK